MIRTARRLGLLLPLILGCWIGLTAGAAEPRVPAVEPRAPQERLRISELTVEDQSRLDFQRGVAAALVREHLARSLKGEPEDLALLQKLLDDGVLETDQTFYLQALGVAFGDAVAKSTGLSWVIAMDSVGRSRALHMRQSELVVFPVTMISKRVAAGEVVQLQALYAEVQELVKAERLRR